MSCYRPSPAWASRSRSAETGKRETVFSLSEGVVDMPRSVPCGVCDGCLSARQQAWSLRCAAEAASVELSGGSSWFVTLTYDDEHCPVNDAGLVTLRRSDLVEFKRSLRDRGLCFRTMECGQYGGRTGRPHYHFLGFGLDLSDRSVHGDRHDALLAKVWGKGFVDVGVLRDGGAAYVARYASRYVNRAAALASVPPGCEPEFLGMSRRPGLGCEFVRRYGHDLRSGAVVLRGGTHVAVPRYYLDVLERVHPGVFAAVKMNRTRFMVERSKLEAPSVLNLQARSAILKARRSLAKAGRVGL